MESNEILIKIFKQYPATLNDTKLFKALLSDFFLDDKLSRNMFGILADELIINDMAKKCIVDTIDLGRYAQIVQRDYGFTKEQISPYLEILVDALYGTGIIDDYEVDWFLTEEILSQMDMLTDSINKNFDGQNIEEDIYNNDIEDESNEVEEYYSIKELLIRKTPKPLIVVKSSWHGDYCMVVDYILNGWAYGVCYRNGKAYKDDKQGSKVVTFSEYTGPSKTEILQNHVPVRGDIQLGASLREFWTNRGFEVVDERREKKNGYLFVKGTEEELEPYVEVVKKEYDVNGHFQPCRVFNYAPGWGTISRK